MYILGINESHCSTACLLKDGEIIACASEERFTRNKNQWGFPANAIDFVLKYAGIGTHEVDLVNLSFNNPMLVVGYNSGKPISDRHTGKILRSLAQPIYNTWHDINYYVRDLALIESQLYSVWRALAWSSLNKERFGFISEKLDNQKILSTDHHICHGYCAYLDPKIDGKQIVFTLDQTGDNSCGEVNIIENGSYRNIALTPNGKSLGKLYESVTKYLGMKPLEHEYKVMGLAPYASQYEIKKTYDILSKLVWLEDGLKFNTKMKDRLFYRYLKDNLEGHRFDGIAGAVQQFTEDLLTTWVRNTINKTGIDRIFLGGGVFMNIKANMKILELPEVRDMFVMPSCGDESTAMGAAVYGYQYLCKLDGKKCSIKPLKDLYLGPEFSNDEIYSYLKQKDLVSKYNIEKCDVIESEIAELLSKNKIVARFSGRMEWGARALGNRSILANPSNLQNIRILNEQIKSRDFWMPFASTILKERENDYVINPKKVASPYMVLAFNTTDRARKDLMAAIHPYDHTIRPQILEKDWNGSYYKVIKEFENVTGIGGVLNTSFNLHGEPVVCSPADAIHTFEDSGLEYLAIGNYLIHK